MRTVRKIYYNTKHYMPISQADYKKIEEMLDLNSLPKMDRTLFDVLHYLGKRERKGFKVHDIETAFNLVTEKANQYKEEQKSMKDSGSLILLAVLAGLGLYLWARPNQYTTDANIAAKTPPAGPDLYASTYTGSMTLL